MHSQVVDHAAQSDRWTRRRFLSAALGAAVAPTILPASVLGRDGALPPSERITIGMLGVGNRGSSSLRAMQPLPDHQVVAIADPAVRERNWLNSRSTRCMPNDWVKRCFRGCEIYNDFRDVVARDDIDAIWGCVPDHWHGVAYCRVIEAGKDLYGEKPITRWIAEGIQVRDAVRRYGCVFQTGTQQRSDPKFRHACELARNGYLGKVHTVSVGAPGANRIRPRCPAIRRRGSTTTCGRGRRRIFPLMTGVVNGSPCI
jgi:predicted dehydrogenase